MHDVSFIDVDEKLEWVANDENQDDANKNSSHGNIPSEAKNG